MWAQQEPVVDSLLRRFGELDSYPTPDGTSAISLLAEAVARRKHGGGGGAAEGSDVASDLGSKGVGAGTAASLSTSKAAASVPRFYFPRTTPKGEAFSRVSHSHCHLPAIVVVALPIHSSEIE
jgi:hypothetical protein